MSLLTVDELLEKLRNGDESVEIEAKTSQEVGRSIWETISAFSNEPMRDGGYILCGVARSAATGEYQVVGVPDPDKLQRDLASQCRESFNLPVRPLMTVERCEGKTALRVYITEAQPQEKPVYIVSKGLPKGAFRRIGSTDQVCTDEDIALFHQYRDHKTFDETVLPDTTIDDFDPEAISAYRRARTEVNPSAAELSYSDEDLLYALAATSKTQGRTCATVAGIMLFGKHAALRRQFSMTRVDYILVEGREWVPDPERRFQAVEMRGPLMTLIPRVVAQVMGDIPKAFSLGDGIFRRETPLIPLTVIREAVVNALMHRSYRQHQPVQIIRYSNRIEICNPGHSLKPDDRLGEPGSYPRNAKIAAAIHEAALAETKGSGIRAMREAMANANLTMPFFESDRAADTFTTRLLLHHLLGQEDVEWLTQFKDCHLSDDEARVLIVLREMGIMNNALYRELTGLDTLTVSKHLQRLRDLKLLEQKGKSSATYYMFGERFQTSLAPAVDSVTSDGNPSDKPIPVESNPSDKPIPVESNPSDKSLDERLNLLPQGFPRLPELLWHRVEALGPRATAVEVDLAVLALCVWRTMQAFEIATLLGRSVPYIRETYLSPMVHAGELAYVHPENPAHPQQGYQVTDKGKELLERG